MFQKSNVLIFLKNEVFIGKGNLNNWIEKNYSELERICKRTTKGEPYDELFQHCIEQFLINKRVREIPDNEKLFFFAKIVTNSYNSKTSPYHSLYRKTNFVELTGIEIEDKNETQPEITLDWVKEQLVELKKTDWYFARLMELYLEEECSISKLARRTTIPLNSVSRDINKIRKILRDKREKLLK